MSNKISVIVPIYNVEKLLRKCLDSLIAQTYKNLEIILVEDGSPDNCGRICDEYAEKDDRIIVIHQENAGVCAARNAALEIATGDYYGFADPDDYLEPDMFEYLITNLKKHDADISCCRYYRHLRDGRVIKKTDGELYIFSREEAIKELLKINTIKAVFWNKLFKKELFEGVTFPEGLIYEGTIMVHRLFQKCDKIVYLPEAKYYYYDFEESYVNNKSLKHQCNYVLAQIIRYTDLVDEFPELKRKMIKKIFTEISILTKICYMDIDTYEKHIDEINEIGKFVKDNLDYIVDNNSTKRVGGANLKFVMNPTKQNLKKAHMRQILFDTKKDRNRGKKIEESRNRRN